MLPAGSIVRALRHKLQTQSSAPEDGQNYRPKHVELFEIINKIIITVASGWLFVLLYQWCTVTQTSDSIELLNMEICLVISDLFHASKRIWIDRLFWICTAQGHEHKQEWNVGTEYYIRSMLAYSGCCRRSWRQGNKNDEFISITLPKWKSR